MTADRPGFDSAALSPDQERALQRLAFAIEAGQGRFKLLIARCNYGDLVDRLLVRLQTLCEVEVRRLVLQPGDRQLFAAIERAIDSNPPGALAVVGLGELTDADLRELFAQANRSREAFRDRFPLPLVWWLDDRALRQLQTTASDLASWTTTQTFEATATQLADWIQTMADRIRAWVLETNFTSAIQNPKICVHELTEIAVDWSTLLQCPDLTSQDIAVQEANVAWLQALITAQPNSIAEAHEGYQKASHFWWQNGDLIQFGAVQITLAQFWQRCARFSRRHYKDYLTQSSEAFEIAITTFNQANRLDLCAKFINSWGDTLLQLNQWHSLQLVTQQALELHRQYLNPFKQAKVYGLCGELALQNQDWQIAIRWFEQAIATIQGLSVGSHWLPGDPESKDWVRYRDEASYWFGKGQAQFGLEQYEESRESLATAHNKGEPDFDPRLSIAILKKLAETEWQLRDYRYAFSYKFLYQSLEEEFNFRAFVGVSHLATPKVKELQGSKLDLEFSSRAISAAGRKHDVERILGRLKNDRGNSITVLFGFSGSGKSSLLNAGIIPAVRQETLGSRSGLPVVLRDYSNWEEKLWQSLKQALLAEHQGRIEPPTDGNWQGAIARELVRNAEQRNLATVLIFDQFEEFFFEHGQRQGRSPLFAFLSQCLDITGLKIIFSIRREYIYYLLNRAELDQRIDGGLLSTHVLYRIGNFRLEEAKQVIRDLIDRAELDWEPELIEAIVSDLSGNYYKVRPIELQIVGAQVQAEGITTAAGYANSGGKVALVQRYLDAATGDCGPENVELAKLILFLLTGDQPIRPLKSQLFLHQEVTDLEQDPSALNLVLEILTDSGLLLKNHSQNKVTYQIVHDYIAEFIQKQTKVTFLAEIAQEKAQRQATELKLLKQHQIAKRRFASLKSNIQRMKKLQKRVNVVFLASLIMTIIASFLSWDSSQDLKQIIEREQTILRTISTQDDQLAQLSNLLRIGFTAKQLGLDSQSLISLRETLGKYLLTVQEINLLKVDNQAHIRDIKLSPDDQLLAIALEDGTARIWNIKEMQEIRRLKHSSVKNAQTVYSVSFSPDSQWLLTSAQDGTAKIWDLTDPESQRPFSTLNHSVSGEIRAASFDSTGKWIITLGDDGEAKIWQWNKQRKSVHAPLITLVHSANQWLSSANFSPDGRLVFTAGGDGVIKVWDWQKNENLKISNSIKSKKFDSSILSADFSADNQWLGVALKNGVVKLWNWSANGRTISLTNHSDSVRSISFGKKNQFLLVTASSDKSAMVWEWNHFIGENNSHLHKKTITLPHPNWVERARFSSDEKQVISGSNGGVIRFWNVYQGAVNLESLRDRAMKKMSAENLLQLDVAKNLKLNNASISNSLLHTNLNNFTESDWLRVLSQTEDLDGLLQIGCDWLRDYLTTNRDAPADLQQFCRVKPSQKP